MFSKNSVVGVAGCGTMGIGIAQVAATKGHDVVVYDMNQEALAASKNKLEKILNRLVEKQKFSEEQMNSILERMTFSNDLSSFSNCEIVFEAIIENLEIKKEFFGQLENIIDENAVIASNTSSLSISAIGSGCKLSGRVIGAHFFNPVPLMPLVEIIPSVTTDEKVVEHVTQLIDHWGKVTVLAKDTPGFIVNRIARPFYGEALRIYEENLASIADIDTAMKEVGGFRMGPFELMDYIGNDINFTVTETVFKAFYYDPRYKPSFTQQRMMEAGLLGRKSGKGYYSYEEGVDIPEATFNVLSAEEICNRIVLMLINEAADAFYLRIASKEHLDLAMTKGVNYPKGLLAWADELGIKDVLSGLEKLFAEYGEDRYRPSPILRKMAKEGQFFYA